MDRISFDQYGEGPVVVLLHGFCENRLIWKNFINYLPGGFRYLVPDIPGFGESPLSDRNVSLRAAAETLISWLHAQTVQDFFIIGHSMGGYIALEIARKSGERCTGLGLFHSTAAADSEVKKENRTKSAAFIQKNGKEAFFKTFIPGLYHQGGDWEDDVRNLIMSTSQDAVVAYTLAMRDRADHRDFLVSFAGKSLFIAGKMDSFIPAEALREQAETASDSLFVLLENAGHLGMLEAPEEAARAVCDFLKKGSVIH